MDDDSADDFEDRVQDEVEERLNDGPIVEESLGRPRSGGCALLLFIPAWAGLWFLA
jgi:hypothetical protein